MNKAQLIDAVADRLGGSRRDANDAVEALIDTITRTVAGGDRVAITGFGVFEKVDRPARMARNPRTGERVRVKKTAVPRFRAGQGLKDVVSGSRKLPRLSGARASASRASASRPAASKATASKPSTTAKATASRGAAKSAPGKSSVRVASKSSGSARTTRKANNTSPARKTTAKRAPKK